jgi:hypothetical protein
MAWADQGGSGPYVTIVSSLPNAPTTSHGPPPLPSSSKASVFNVDPSRDEPVVATVLPVPAASSSAPALATPKAGLPGVSFYSAPDYDMTGATNGLYIFDIYGGIVYDFTGDVIQSGIDLFCGSNPIPECSYGGFVGDPRVYYDLVAGRWIVSGLWVYGSNEPPGISVLAVSQTSDPMGAWDRYQYPTCGPGDSQDGGDQPHVGFNDKWIVVNSWCSASGAGGHSVQVFDKGNVYAGGALNFGVNWFDFQDQVTNGDGRADNPVASYVPASKEFLTYGHVNSNGKYQVVYSTISGPANAPVYTPDTKSVTISNFDGLLDGPTAANAPGCTSCLSSLVLGFIHSSGMYARPNGHHILASANVSTWTAYPNTNVAEFVVTDLAANSSYASVVGSPGTGILGAEIAAPPPAYIQAPEVYTIYASSAPNFYPGIQYYEWNYGTNEDPDSGSFQGGDVPPPGSFEAGRWLDYMTCAGPVPGQGGVLFSGPIGVPPAGESCTAQAPNCQSMFWYSN